MSNLIKGTKIMVSTTGSSIQSYLDWIKAELLKKDYGEVAIRFTITNGQVTDVRKESIDKDHFALSK